MVVWREIMTSTDWEGGVEDFVSHFSYQKESS